MLKNFAPVGRLFLYFMGIYTWTIEGIESVIKHWLMDGKLCLDHLIFMKHCIQSVSKKEIVMSKDELLSFGSTTVQRLRKDFMQCCSYVLI